VLLPDSSNHATTHTNKIAGRKTNRGLRYQGVAGSDRSAKPPPNLVNFPSAKQESPVLMAAPQPDMTRMI